MHYYSPLHSFLDPASILLAAGVPISISPDDPAALGYDDIAYDWTMAFLSWDIDLLSLKQLGYNSLLYSSLEKKEKRLAIQQYFTMFHEWAGATLLLLEAEKVIE